MISKEVIEEMEKQSRLFLADDKREKSIQNIAVLFDFMSKVSRLDIKDISMTQHLLDSTNCFREDIVDSAFTREEMLANAKEKTEAYYKAPKTLE